jgi:ABC-type proline/glycine betaine transport system ATPase subunit
MAKRVEIVRMLAIDPEVLLMDEPFGALDAQTKIHMQNVLLNLLQNMRKTVIFITHDLEEAVVLSDRSSRSARGRAGSSASTGSIWTVRATAASRGSMRGSRTICDRCSKTSKTSSIQPWQRRSLMATSAESAAAPDALVAGEQVASLGGWQIHAWRLGILIVGFGGWKSRRG